MAIGGARAVDDGARLLGRDELTERTAALLSDPANDGVVLHGDPGAGTSAVAEAALGALADEVAHRVLRLAPGATASASVFGALALALGESIADLPTAVERLAARLAEHDIEAILLDPADQVDPASAEVLVGVARSRSIPVVAVHHRATNLAPALAESVGSGRYGHLAVEPLDPTDAAGVAADRLGGDLSPRSVRWLNSLTQGRPRLIELLVDAARDERTVRLTDAGMALQPEIVSSPLVRTWLDGRLSSLHADDRIVLEAVAVLEPTTPAEIAAVLGDEAALAQLDHVCDHGVVSVSNEQRRIVVRHTDPLVTFILLRAVSASERRRLRVAAMEALGPERERRRRTDRLRVAAWSLDGDASVGGAGLFEAARHELRSGRLDEARQYAELAHSAEQSIDSAQRFARILLAIGEWPALRAHTSDWLARIDDDEQRAALASVAASGRFWLGADEGALRDLDEFAIGLTGPAALQITATRAALAVSAGRVREGVDLAEPLLAAIDHASDLDSEALLALRVGYAYQGRPMAALRLLDLAVGDQASSPTRHAEWRLPVLAMAGEVVATRRVFDEAMVDAAGSGSPGRVALVLYTLGSTHLDYGRVAEAIPLLDEAKRWARLAAHDGVRRWVALALAYASALVGELDESRQHLAEAEALGHHPARLNDSFLWRARAWIAHQRGEAETGRTLLLEGAGRARAVGNVLEQLECLVDLARLGWIDDAVAAVDGIEVASVDGRFLPAQVAFVRAVGSGDVESELDALDQLVESGAYYLAVDLAVAAARRSSEAGDHETATMLMRRADSLRATDHVADPFGVARAAVAQLSDRELEVALLAVQGRSSRDIGAALFISTRTVDTHLGRIYKKLDVHSRAELAERVRHG